MQIQEQVCLLELLEQHQKPARSPVKSVLLILGQILLQMRLREKLLFTLMLAAFHVLFLEQTGIIPEKCTQLVSVRAEGSQ